MASDAKVTVHVPGVHGVGRASRAGGGGGGAGGVTTIGGGFGAGHSQAPYDCPSTWHTWYPAHAATPAQAID